MTAFAVMLAGGLGATARHLVGTIPTNPRLATWLVNVTGSAILGFLLGAGLSGAVWTAGFLGGFTTFSTAAVESAQLAERGDLRNSTLHAWGMALACTTAAVLLHTAAVVLF